MEKLSAATTASTLKLLRYFWSYSNQICQQTQKKNLSLKKKPFFVSTKDYFE